MLTIREAQMEAFREAAFEGFRCRLALHLAEVFRERGQYPDEWALNANVDRALQHCPEFFLSRERDVAAYAEIACRHLGGVPEMPLPKEALNILYSYRVDPEIRLKRFEEWAKGEGR
jgi:hypothetical protein